jgi:hypothetical protein
MFRRLAALVVLMLCLLSPTVSLAVLIGPHVETDSAMRFPNQGDHLLYVPLIIRGSILSEPTVALTATPSSTASATATPSATITLLMPTVTRTPASTETATPSVTAPMLTLTVTPTPTIATPTPTSTLLPIETATVTPTSTAAAGPSMTPTAAPTFMPAVPFTPPHSPWAFVPLLGSLAPGGILNAAVNAQNVGNTDTKLAIAYFSINQGFCPPQAAPPFKLDCTGLLKPGSGWTWVTSAAAQSALVFSVNPSPASNPNYYECNQLQTLVGRVWPSEWPGGASPQFPFDWSPFQGEPVAVTIQRALPGNVSPDGAMLSAYTGLTAAMQTAYDPLAGGYSYYVPVVFSGYLGFNSYLAVQNSGAECTSLEVWFKAQDDCLRAQVCEIQQLAPGYMATFNVAGCVPPGFIGSAWIRAAQPLSIAAEHVGPNVLRTETAAPTEQAALHDGSWTSFGPPPSILYAPLVYTQPPWHTRLHIQNLSSITTAVLSVELLNQVGEVVSTLTGEACPRGNVSFDVMDEAIKTVRVRSVPRDGDPAGPLPVVGIVEISQPRLPGFDEHAETMSYAMIPVGPDYVWGNGPTEARGTALLSLPSIYRHATEEGITTRVALQNTASGAGAMRVAILVSDQNGLLDYECVSLHGNEVMDYDLNDRGWLSPGFRGSLVISATYWERSVNVSGPISVGLIAVQVEHSQVSKSIARVDRAWAITGVALPPTPGLVPAGAGNLCPSPTATPIARR